MWRDGKLLVIIKGEEFPDRCVKTNEPAHGRRVLQAVSWHHPIWYLAHLASPLAYVLAANVVMKGDRFYVGVSDQWHRKRRRAFFWSVAIIIVSLTTSAYGIALLAGGTWWPFCLGVLGTVAGLLCWLNASTLLVAKRISSDYVWLKGVHPDFLADLPDWPGEPTACCSEP